mgnify:FL=1
MLFRSQTLGKPVCLPYCGGWLGGPSLLEAESDPHLACFQSIDRCFATLAAWHKRDARIRSEEQHGPRKLARLSPADAAEKAARLIAASSNTTLTEREAKQVLAAYGVPVVGEQLVQSAAEAARAAEGLGFPVVLKAESPDLPHKTEAGVICLNLQTAAQVVAAYDQIIFNGNKYLQNKPQARIHGVLVQPMLPAGVEIMAGARIDPQFGPLIVVGLGGIFVELLKDTALELAPVTNGEARAMLHKLKGRQLLDGFRGSEAVNVDALADVIVRLSEFAEIGRAHV